MSILVCMKPSQNEKNHIHSHSKFVIGIQYMMYYKMINFDKFCVMHRFLIFVRFLCFWLSFLCLGLNSYVFAGEFCLGVNIGVHDNHHKMKKIILIHIPNLLLGFNI